VRSCEGRGGIDRLPGHAQGTFEMAQAAGHRERPLAVLAHVGERHKFDWIIEAPRRHQCRLSSGLYADVDIDPASLAQRPEPWFRI
jgi:hypothetical protein